MKYVALGSDAYNMHREDFQCGSTVILYSKQMIKERPLVGLLGRDWQKVDETVVREEWRVL